MYNPIFREALPKIWASPDGPARLAASSKHPLQCKLDYDAKEKYPGLKSVGLSGPLKMTGTTGLVSATITLETPESPMTFEALSALHDGVFQKAQKFVEGYLEGVMPETFVRGVFKSSCALRYTQNRLVRNAPKEPTVQYTLEAEVSVLCGVPVDPRVGSAFSAKIQAVLRGVDTGGIVLVYVWEGSLIADVISDAFEGKREGERQALVWQRMLDHPGFEMERRKLEFIFTRTVKEVVEEC